MEKEKFQKVEIKLLFTSNKVECAKRSVINKLSQVQLKANREFALFALNRDYFYANFKAKKKSLTHFFQDIFLFVTLIVN